MATSLMPRISASEYLELERSAEFRSEFLQGEMVAMSGGTFNHSRISMRVGSRLDAQLEGKPCEPAGSDTRIRIAEYDVFTYPDVAVICGEPKFHDGRMDTVTDATLIVEVLSKSTQNYVRSEKFRYYRALPSFAEYLLIAQDSIRAEHHTRQPDNSWLFREYGGADTVIELKSIGCQLRLGDLYSRIRFENQ